MEKSFVTSGPSDDGLSGSSEDGENVILRRLRFDLENLKDQDATFTFQATIGGSLSFWRKQL